jgi:hypothetical protein
MKKAIYNKRGTRQIINSGWKEFDKQTNCISTGNVYASTQMSSFIRPWKETECNGFERPKGELMHFDLQPFIRHHIPQFIYDRIVDIERQDSVILYMFYVMKDGRVEPFGWLLSTREHDYITSCVKRSAGQSYAKRANALFEAKSYVCN